MCCLKQTSKINNDIYKPYKKVNNPTYINKISNHPPNAFKHTPISLNKRISSNFSNIKLFAENKKLYEWALKKYLNKLEFKRFIIFCSLSQLYFITLNVVSDFKCQTSLAAHSPITNRIMSPNSGEKLNWNAHQCFQNCQSHLFEKCIYFPMILNHFNPQPFNSNISYIYNVAFSCVLICDF